MRPLKSLARLAKSEAQKNVTRGKIVSIDFNRAFVVPNGTSGKINASIVGDPNTLSIGQEVEIIFGSNGTLVMANAEKGSNKYTLENHSVNHSKVGHDQITPEMIGAAQEDHMHDVTEIAGLDDLGGGGYGFVRALAQSENLDYLSEVGYYYADGTQTNLPSIGLVKGIVHIYTSDGQPYVIGSNVQYQLFSKNDGDTYIRFIDALATPWAKVWTDKNTGLGSGLVADVAGSANTALALDTNPSGQHLTISATQVPVGNVEALIQTQGSGSGTSFITINAIDSYGNPHALVIGPSGMNYNDQKIFHSGNDGAGSGLDADKLDGYQASEFFRMLASGEISSLTAKTTPVDADTVLIEDSAASNAKKKITWASIKATLKSYFDTIYTLANLGGVPTSRTISTASPLEGGGALSGNLTLSMPAATTDTPGYMGAALVTQLSMAVKTNIGGQINGVTTKATPAAADVVLIEDSAASWAKKKTTVGSLTAIANADTLDGFHASQIAYGLRSNTVTGGGVISVTSANVRWSTRFISMGSGRGADLATSGYFNIEVPAVGTVITGVGGASNVTVVANGIPMNVWTSLYYILPLGGTTTSVPGNFRVAYYTADYTPDPSWIKICSVNNDGNPSYCFINGLVLANNQSWNSDSTLGGRGWTYLSTPVGSASWQGVAKSTTGKSWIDLSATFSGVPDGISAVLVRTMVRDSGTPRPDTLLLLSGNSSDMNGGYFNRCDAMPSNYWHEMTAVVPCDAIGNIYYQIIASGAGTMDIWMTVLGYCLP